MKKITLLVASALAWLNLSNSAFAVPQTYVLKCRPGPNTSFNISVTGDLRFGFVRAPVAAGPTGSALQRGQCAWVDRPIGAGEPAYFAAAMGPKFQIGAVIPHELNNSFKAYLYASQQAWVMDFQKKDTILTIRVYNDGQYLRAPNP